MDRFFRFRINDVLMHRAHALPGYHGFRNQLCVISRTVTEIADGTETSYVCRSTGVLGLDAIPIRVMEHELELWTPGPLEASGARLEATVAESIAAMQCEKEALAG